jgi:hypothetical protein
MHEAFTQGEKLMKLEQAPVAKIATLDFGQGKVGQNVQLVDPEAEAQFAGALHTHTHELTVSNTADCGDGRRTIRLASGEQDPAVLRERVVPQLFGGLGLAATKALVAANARLVSDATSFWQAYETVSTTLANIRRGAVYYEDAGHEGCGASASVEASVASKIAPELLIPSIGLLVPVDETVEAHILQNAANKQRRLETGFYSDWDPQKHADYLISHFSHNFSYLEVDPNDSETHGHNEAGVYVITSENQGFAKNEFVEDTGRQAFAVTFKTMQDIARKLGGSDEERLDILLGFVDDTLHVGAGLVMPGMPVFAE